MSGLAVSLPRVNAMLELADRHEEKAVELAQHWDAGSVAKSADHFTVAAGLRGRARFAK